MTNRHTVLPQDNGTQVWENRVLETGETLRYVFIPKAQLTPGTQVESMRIFERENNGRGNGLSKKTESAFTINAAFIAALPNGSFLRVREAP